MNKNLTKEGSISFWIRLKNNPPFSDPESNIKFMHKQDVGGVLLTILKEKSVMRVVVENSKYGVARLESDISKLLTQDMMVALTWTPDSVKFYINGALVSESVYA
jgi:hypothetical protein